MELKPGYKQTEVGVIPEDWEVKRLGEVCLKIQDGTHFSPKLGGNDFLYITSRNIRTGKLDLSDVARISADQHHVIYRRCDVRFGDLLLTKDGANTGNAALNTILEQFSLLSSVAMLRFDYDKYEAPYFMFQILGGYGQSQIKDAMSGNAITRLTLQKIRVLRFPVPPLPEQKAIAEALSDMDSLLGGLDSLIAKKRDIKQATMQQLLTGKTRLPGFSGEWEQKRLGEVGQVRMCKRVLKHQTAEYGDVPFFKIGTFGSEPDSFISFELFHELSSKFSYPRQGDILISAAGTIGRAVVFNGEPSYFQDSNIVWIDNTESIVLNEFLWFVYHVTEWVVSHGGTVARLYNDSLRNNIFIPIPPLPEQQAIAKVLTDMDAELEALDQRRYKTRELKQAMMQELLTGRTRLV